MGAVGKFGERLRDPHLHIRRELGQCIGRLLRHPPAIPRGAKVRQQPLPDHLDPGQLGTVGVAGGCHHVPHPALRELKTVLLQLIQQRLHTLRLLADLCAGELAGGAVGKDQSKFLKRRGGIVRLPDAVHPAELTQSFFHKLSQGSPAPVAADDGKPSALTGPHPDRLLQAAHLDVVRQLVNVRQLVEIPLVAVQKADVDVLNLLRAGSVQIRHAGQLLTQHVHHVQFPFFHPQHLPEISFTSSV